MARALSLLCNLGRFAGDSVSPQIASGRNFFSALTLFLFLTLPVLAQNRATPLCRQLVFIGEVKQGAEWTVSFGHPATAKESASNWLIRLVPTGNPSASGASPDGYAGWTLAVSPSADQDYPDALLLASPPYGSLNAREIAATYGMRAQDAVSWSPRRFHFFLSSASLMHARRLYRDLLDPAVSAANRRRASMQLLDLSTDASRIASGRLEILDAHLVAGSADPAPFAAQWAAVFDRLPHTLDPARKPSPQGELHSLRFRITLWIPTSWKPSFDVESKTTKCAE